VNSKPVRMADGRMTDDAAIRGGRMTDGPRESAIRSERTADTRGGATLLAPLLPNARMHRVSTPVNIAKPIVLGRPLPLARLNAIARPGLRTPKVGDSSGTPAHKLFTCLVVRRATPFEKPMSVEAKTL
jgi:hypothetical protein